MSTTEPSAAAAIETALHAVIRAPSPHNTQPWVLEFHSGSISLFERLDLSPQRHDLTCRDRLISCGTALANLLLAVRIPGWDAELLLFPDRVRPDEVARVVAAARRAPSDVDQARYAAIPWRRSHRGPFAGTPVPDDLRHQLVTASAGGGVQVRLSREYLLLVETPDDGHRDHVLAGRAIQDTWLSAIWDGRGRAHRR